MLDRKAFYSPAALGDVVGLSSATILNYIHSGKLYAVKLSERTYRIPLAAVIATFHPDQLRGPRSGRRTGDAEAAWRQGLRVAHAAYARPAVRRRAGHRGPPPRRKAAARV